MQGDGLRAFAASRGSALAHRAIERYLSQERTQTAFDRMVMEDNRAAMRAVQLGDIVALRHLVRQAEVATLDDLTFTELRSRASTLNIPRFNAMTRAELIESIKKTETAVQAQLETLMRCSIFRTGFIHGDGI